VLFDDLNIHCSEQQVIHFVATISLFGFLNRRNDTMTTTLQPEVAAYAARHLSTSGCEIGKHGVQ